MSRRLARVALLLLLKALLLPAAVIHIYGRIDHATEVADVIVVLGAGLERGNRPGRALTRRAQQAAILYARGVAQWVICTGGIGAGRSRSEADACRELLEVRGVPARAILLEDSSRSTEENTLRSKALMAERGWQSAVVVSDGYHLLRARWLFWRIGQPVSTSPAADPPLAWHVPYILREVGVFYWLGLRFLLNLPETLI